MTEMSDEIGNIRSRKLSNGMQRCRGTMVQWLCSFVVERSGGVCGWKRRGLSTGRHARYLSFLLLPKKRVVAAAYAVCVIDRKRDFFQQPALCLNARTHPPPRTYSTTERASRKAAGSVYSPAHEKYKHMRRSQPHGKIHYYSSSPYP